MNAPNVPEADTRTAVLMMMAGGLSAQRIADALNLSRQQVLDLLAAGPSKSKGQNNLRPPVAEPPTIGSDQCRTRTVLACQRAERDVPVGENATGGSSPQTAGDPHERAN